MVERFSNSLGKHLFVASGWVFTVGGAIGSFVLSQSNAWIGWLAVLTGVLALTGQNFFLHRRCRELEEISTNQAEQLRNAERKLNEVPLDLVNRIRELVTPQSFTAVATRLAAHADYIYRIREFTASAANDIHLRTFSRRDGNLYAVAKIAAAGLAHLREKDVFFLVQSTEGLRTDCAVMVVHQTPNAAQGIVHFRLVALLSEDARALDQLATAREVTGLNGYTLRPACDPAWYVALQSDTIPEAIMRLAEGLERERRTGS